MVNWAAESGCDSAIAFTAGNTIVGGYYIDKQLLNVCAWLVADNTMCKTCDTIEAAKAYVEAVAALDGK